VYNLAGETVPLEAAVTFDMNGTLSAGITHVPGSAAITVVNSGTYAITFSVSGVEPNQMAVFVNGVVVPGSIYGSGSGTQTSGGQVIVAIPAGGVITLVNHTSTAAVGLQALAGGTQTNTDASVVIEQVG
jgi:hypothetical protein